MATLIQSINHFMTGSIKGSAEVFASIFYLLDEYGPNVGIRRVAYNTGSYPFGAGMYYGNTEKSSSNNAWACFYWSTAENPFFMLIQYATSSTDSYPFGNIRDGAQGVLKGNDPSVSQGGVGIQFAAVPYSLTRLGEIDIWNGSRFTNGKDRKNFPCPWNTASNDVVIFPRSNNEVPGRDSGQLSPVLPGRNQRWAAGGIKDVTYGDPAVTRSMYSCIVSQNDLTSRSLMWHVMADGDSFMFLKNFGSSSSSFSYSGMYFGPYEEAVGFNSKMRYVMINHQTSAFNDPPFSPLSSGSYYGERTGTGSFDGGVAFPSCISGCFAAALEIPTFISDSKFTPARLFSGSADAPIYDEFPWGLAAYDPEGQVFGFCGSIRFMRALWGVSTHTVFSQSMRAAFGNSVTGSVKMTVPWHTGSRYLPGANLHLTGTQVMFTTTY
jgi:hypothetical protein